jgi:dATP pyrophosphohydrolase
MAHRKVQCWIFYKPSDSRAFDPLSEGQCLLLKTNAARGSFWQPVTGSVEPGEGIYQAACREPLEETGFGTLSPPQDTGYEFDFNSGFGPTKERVFALSIDEMLEPTLDPKEHQSFQWVSPAHALTLLRYPSNLTGLRVSFKLLFGVEVP